MIFQIKSDTLASGAGRNSINDHDGVSVSRYPDLQEEGGLYISIYRDRDGQ